MDEDRAENGQATNADRESRTSRRRFLGRAAAAAAASTAVVGGVQAAGITRASAATYSGPTDWLNVQADFGAKGDGATDDTLAIQSAITAAGPGHVVFFPAGNYVVSAPLVISNPGVTLLGDGPLAASGTADNASHGAVLWPSANWAQDTAVFPGAIVANAVNMTGIERLWINGSKARASTSMHGFVLYGNSGACSIVGCGVQSLPNGTAFLLQPDAALTYAPQGAMLDRCLAGGITGHGFSGAFGDGTITRCHSQTTTGNGFSIAPVTGQAGRGGDIRISDCRGDLSSTGDGFFIDIPTGGNPGNIVLANCTTQRNNGSGFHVSNSGGGPGPGTSVVMMSSCIAQADGIAGSPKGAFTFTGATMVAMAACSSLVGAADVPTGVPLYAVVTGSSPSGTPKGLQISGGFFNAVTAFSDKIAKPSMSDVRALAYIGGMWGTSDVPTLVTTL